MHYKLLNYHHPISMQMISRFKTTKKCKDWSCYLLVWTYVYAHDHNQSDKTCKEKYILTICWVWGQDDDVSWSSLDWIPKGSGTVWSFKRHTITVSERLKRFGFSLQPKYQSTLQSWRIIYKNTWIVGQKISKRVELSKKYKKTATWLNYRLF